VKKLLKDMTEPELKAMFSGIAKWLENALPPGPGPRGNCLFALVVTDSIEPGVGQYVSNVVRSDMVKMLRETADRLERREDIER
jgi:hypothetical protein